MNSDKWYEQTTDLMPAEETLKLEQIQIFTADCHHIQALASGMKRTGVQNLQTKHHKVLQQVAAPRGRQFCFIVTILQTLFFKVGLWQNGFSADFCLPPDFSADFVAGFLSPHFGGEKVPRRVLQALQSRCVAVLLAHPAARDRH